MFNRYVNDWNSLPNFVMSASSLNSFKALLLNYLCKQSYVHYFPLNLDFPFYLISKQFIQLLLLLLLFFLLVSRDVQLCISFLFLIVLSFRFGGQFLYGNSVSPYCFPLPIVLLYMYTAISRTVVGKMWTRQSRKVIWNMINTLFLTTVPVEPTFVAFLQHSQTHFHCLRTNSFKFL